jgi:hypothetical protein
MAQTAYRECFRKSKPGAPLCYSDRVAMPMRRVQAILVIFALLAIPPALLAGFQSCASAVCPICAAASHGKSVSCRCPMQHMSNCGTKAPLPDFALVSPLAPTAPLPFFELNAPSMSRVAQSDFAAHSSHGFFSPPFAPPRS